MTARFRTTHHARWVVAAVALFMGVTTPGLRHLHLERSEPEKDARLTEAPTAVRLWFNEAPTLAASRIRLKGPDGDVPMGEVTMTQDGNGIQTAILDSLSAGRYQVSWRTAGDDGHAAHGKVRFRIARSSEATTELDPASRRVTGRVDRQWRRQGR